MEIKEVISELKNRFGDKIDVAKITEVLKGHDLSKLSFTEITEKLGGKGLLGDLDGDGVKESAFEELKGKAENIIGNIFHHK